MAEVLWLVSNCVQCHTEILHCGRTCCLGFMGIINTLKKEAAEFFTILTTTTILHSVILHKPTDRSFS